MEDCLIFLLRVASSRPTYTTLVGLDCKCFSGTSVCSFIIYIHIYIFHFHNPVSLSSSITSVVLLVNYLRHAFGVDLMGEVRNRGARLTAWAGLLATSLIVMGSSARTYNNDCQPSIFPAEYCSRAKYGIAVGCVTVVASLAIVAMKMLTSTAPILGELVVSGIVATMNAFAVAFITAAKGPGAQIGNLYYSIW